ncbi:MAG: glycerate kinase [Rhodococcus sp.]|nr:glycerate kinase [Rhodococcus sp. (in: high G+C Gram-positive bacteria)]
MRVLIAPDSYGGTLTAATAAAAIAVGWAAARPGDELVQAPCSDGGPGFVDVLSHTIGAIREVEVDGPIDSRVQARWLLDDSDGGAEDRDREPTAYVESAQACGLHLIGGKPSPGTALAAHSRGVGQLVAAALDAGATRIVVGLGGSACTDGGRGFVTALGGLDAARDLLSGVRVTAATDVENPLVGPDGAAYVFGPQKGADSAAVALLEDKNIQWAHDLARATGRPVATLSGAGAAGGLGAALLALGATRVSGADVVAERTSQDEALRTADLVITGEGRLDRQSLQGKAVVALARRARARSVPVLALAGQVDLDKEALIAAGIDDARSLVGIAGSVAAAMADAPLHLKRLAELAARKYE